MHRAQQSSSSGDSRACRSCTDIEVAASRAGCVHLSLAWHCSFWGDFLERSWCRLFAEPRGTLSDR
eukprot:4600305-Amphidinium_carterae.1